jgi:hypothetical protein
MHYSRPQIVASLPAVSAIQSLKGSIPSDVDDPTQLTNGAAYQADE